MILNIYTDYFYLSVQWYSYRFGNGNFGFLTHIGNIATNLACLVFRHKIGHNPFAEHRRIVAIPVGRIVHPRSGKLPLLLPFHIVDTGHISDSIPRRIISACRLVYHFGHTGIEELIKRKSARHIPMCKGIFFIRFLSGNSRQRLSGSSD